MFSLLLILVLFSCSDDIPVENNSPANLKVSVELDPQGNGHAVITATADNASEYEFRLGNSVQPDQKNTTGIFTHTFTQSGTWMIDVRAVGVSGRYLKEEIELKVQLAGVDPNDGFTSPMEYEGYNLVWNDEFGGNTISSDWVFEIGTGCPNICGWGNNELQYYRKENAWVDEGILTIEARKENYQNSAYTSARMKTQGRRSFKYGRVDIRAHLPKGQGIWPALWMLGNSITTVGWPKCGEIDIMEMIGGKQRENTTHGTLHWDNNGHNYTGGSYSLTSGIFADQFYVFSITWDENEIKWYVNNKHFHTINITPTHMTEFHEPFFFLFNIAVGGNWPGNPDANTVFPQQMRVDYIRVFQKHN